MTVFFVVPNVADSKIGSLWRKKTKQNLNLFEVNVHEASSEATHTLYYTSQSCGDEEVGAIFLD